ARLAVKTWLAQLEDENADTRRNAADVLGRLDPLAPEVEKALIAALKDKDATVRDAALAALARPKPRSEPVKRARAGEASRLKEALWAEVTRYPAAQALAEVDPSAHPRLALIIGNGLDKGSSPFRSKELRALAAMGPAARPAIPAVRRYYESVFDSF